MEKMRVKKIFWLGLILFLGFRAWSQEPGFEVFYGEKDFKGARFTYDYFLNQSGDEIALELFYLTKSKKSAGVSRYPYYYGISLEFAQARGYDYPFEEGKGDFASWWLFLWIQGRIFTDDEKPVRGYFDFGSGLGIGEYAVKGEDFDQEWSRLDVVQLRAGAGVQFILGSGWALELGAEVNGILGMGGGFLDRSDLALVGAQAGISLLRWKEK